MAVRLGAAVAAYSGAPLRHEKESDIERMVYEGENLSLGFQDVEGNAAPR